MRISGSTQFHEDRGLSRHKKTVRLNEANGQLLVGFSVPT
jgi:hypothetical protein